MLAQGTTRLGLPRGRLRREVKPSRVVRKGGLEPPYPSGYQILSLARLPVPPLSLDLRLAGIRGQGPASATIFALYGSGSGECPIPRAFRVASSAGQRCRRDIRDCRGQPIAPHRPLSRYGPSAPCRESRSEQQWRLSGMRPTWHRRVRVVRRRPEAGVCVPQLPEARLDCWDLTL